MKNPRIILGLLSFLLIAFFCTAQHKDQSQEWLKKYVIGKWDASCGIEKTSKKSSRHCVLCPTRFNSDSTEKYIDIFEVVINESNIGFITYDSILPKAPDGSRRARKVTKHSVLYDFDINKQEIEFYLYGYKFLFKIILVFLLEQ